MGEFCNEILNEIVIVVVTSLTTLLLSLLIPLKIKVLFIKMISPFSGILTKRPTNKIAGVWKADYTNEIFREKHGCHRVKLYQVGEKIVGESVGNNRRMIIDGKLVCNNYFYGSFIDYKVNSIYYGTFQVKIYMSANEMQGKWVGYNSIGSDSISHGEWNWVMEPDIDPHDLIE